MNCLDEFIPLCQCSLGERNSNGLEVVAKILEHVGGHCAKGKDRKGEWHKREWNGKGRKLEQNGN